MSFSRSTITLLATLSLLTPTFSSPIPGLNSPRATTTASLLSSQLIPNLPSQVDLALAQTYVNAAVTKYSGTHDGNKDYYGEMLNSYIPLSDSLDDAIGQDNVIALDVLADRACIAAANQGSLCNELLAYAYAWYAIQMKGKTGRQLATILGPNNMQILSDDLRVLCLSQDSAEHGNEQYELCQLVAFDTDNLANSLIGASNEANSEDAGNSNSLEYFGLAKLLPAPTTLA